MTTPLQIPLSFSFSGSPRDILIQHRRKLCFGLEFHRPSNWYAFSRRSVCPFDYCGFKVDVYGGKLGLQRLGMGRYGISVERLSEENKMKNKRMVVVRFNRGFGFGGGGGGGRDNSASARILGNLAFAIGLAYLSITGQLGWVLDAIVSVWLLALLLPIVGLGAFIWWAGRDMVQGSCPNCRNEFQVFKSTLNDDLQLCPFCSQPFSVVNEKFVRDPVKFSNQSTRFEDFYSQSAKKGKDPSSVAVVDVEAEVKDVD